MTRSITAVPQLAAALFLVYHRLPALVWAAVFAILLPSNGHNGW